MILEPVPIRHRDNVLAIDLRGQEQIVRAIEDIKRALHIGVRSFLLYDEGLLYIMNCLRQAEEIPKEIKFKISAHCGYSNPASIKLLESMGANSN